MKRVACPISISSSSIDVGDLNFSPLGFQDDFGFNLAEKKKKNTFLPCLENFCQFDIFSRSHVAHGIPPVHSYVRALPPYPTQLPASCELYSILFELERQSYTLRHISRRISDGNSFDWGYVSLSLSVYLVCLTLFGVIGSAKVFFFSFSRLSVSLSRLQLLL